MSYLTLGDLGQTRAMPGTGTQARIVSPATWWKVLLSGKPATAPKPKPKLLTAAEWEAIADTYALTLPYTSPQEVYARAQAKLARAAEAAAAVVATRVAAMKAPAAEKAAAAAIVTAEVQEASKTATRLSRDLYDAARLQDAAGRARVSSQASSLAAMYWTQYQNTGNSRYKDVARKFDAIVKKAAPPIIFRVQK